jgi:hypothetical protein
MARARTQRQLLPQQHGHRLSLRREHFLVRWNGQDNTR